MRYIVFCKCGKRGKVVLDQYEYEIHDKVLYWIACEECEREHNENI